MTGNVAWGLRRNSASDKAGNDLLHTTIVNMAGKPVGRLRAAGLPRSYEFANAVVQQPFKTCDRNNRRSPAVFFFRGSLAKQN